MRSIVVFPDQRTVLEIGRPRSVRAVDAALVGDGRVALFAQREVEVAEPSCADLHPIGTIAEIERRDEGHIVVVGRQRVRLVAVEDREGMLAVGVSASAPAPLDPETVRRTALAVLDRLASGLRKAANPLTPVLPHMHLLPPEIQQQVLETDDPAGFVRALGAALRA